MKILISILLAAQVASAGQIFDEASFLDLSRVSNEVQQKITDCATSQGLSLMQVYPQKISSCDGQTRQSLKNLKDSFKLFTLSALVDNFAQVKNTEKISPLLIQIISENISQFKLDETSQGGGSRGIGLCTSFISIGACHETPQYEISPEIKQEHIAYLRLFDLIPETQCDLGLFPNATVTLINEIAEAQGLTGRNADVIVRDGFFMSGPGVRELKGKSSTAQLITRLEGKFKSSCGLFPQRGSATKFFNSLLNVY